MTNKINYILSAITKDKDSSYYSIQEKKKKTVKMRIMSKKSAKIKSL